MRANGKGLFLDESRPGRRALLRLRFDRVSDPGLDKRRAVPSVAMSFRPAYIHPTNASGKAVNASHPFCYA
jgi:hypothetical protein